MKKVKELPQFTKFIAEFQPKRLDDLKPEYLLLIGTVTEWQTAWLIEDGQFEGQWACMPAHGSEFQFKFGWVPECDLKILE